MKRPVLYDGVTIDTSGFPVVASHRCPSAKWPTRKNGGNIGHQGIIAIGSELVWNPEYFFDGNKVAQESTARP